MTYVFATCLRLGSYLGSAVHVRTYVLMNVIPRFHSPFWLQRSAVSLRAAIAGAALIAFFQGILFGVLVYNRDSLVTRESSVRGITVTSFKPA